MPTARSGACRGAPGGAGDAHRRRGQPGRRRVAPGRRRTMAGPAAAAALRAGGGLDTGAPPPVVVRPPRVRRRRPGLPWPRRVRRAVRTVRRRGARRRGGHRMGGRAAVQRRPGGDLRLLLPGVGPAVRRSSPAPVAARRGGDDVCPGPLRGLDVRGRLPAVAVRRLLERPAGRPGAGARPRALRRRRAAGARGARRGSAAVVRRVAGPSRRRRLLGRPPPRSVRHRGPGVHRPRVPRRVHVGDRPADHRPRCPGGVRSVGPHALGHPARRRRAGPGGRPDRCIRAPRGVLRRRVRGALLGTRRRG